MKQISESKWKKRRIEAEEERKILDKKDSDDFEKMKRLNKVKEKKETIRKKTEKRREEREGKQGRKLEGVKEENVEKLQI